MDSISFGSPLNEKIAQNDVVSSKDIAPEATVPKVKGDLFDSLTSSLSADKTTALAKFLKRFLPTLIFIFTAFLGIGVGKTSQVSGCLRGFYGQIELFFGAIKIPLYSIPDACLTPDKVRDFLSVKPLVFLLSLVLLFFIWSYFDNKLQWRGRGNYQQ